jgi:molybdopterin-guanine dinucleotide biosynthesis protein A
MSEIGYAISVEQRVLNAVVLVGGGSRRMGRPKQKLRLSGATLVEIAVAAVGGLVDRVVVAGGGELPESLDGLERLADAPGVQGPLGGILAAMRWAPESAWLVAACDMPRIRRDAVAWLLSQRGPEVWAVLPKLVTSRVEPLLAVYEPQLLTVLERRAAAGRFGLQDLAGSAHVVCPRPPENLHDAWLNVNTMEEFERSAVIDV